MTGGEGFRQFDSVRLRVDRPDLDLLRGTRGAIVDVYERPTFGYDVEFFDGSGKTLAVATMSPDEIEADSGRGIASPGRGA